MASSSREKHYDVFLSFRGEDTRTGFISHLHEALISNQISTFIDYDLRRGDAIFPSLLTAIQESMISVIILSEKYANSKSCLKELEKIFECKELYGQVVIPVFYQVDPSEVKKQTGKFGVAFDELKDRLAEGEMDLDKVRSHLKEVATISGWNSHDISPESLLLKLIVGDILNKLNGMKLDLPSSLIGIGSHVEHVESLLCLELPEFRMVGLWGMSGIGKTTVAQNVYSRIRSRFDGSYFVEKVSEKLKNHQSVNDLREKIVSKLFEKEILSMGSPTLHLDFITKQLPRKRVLIVLDDVDNPIEAMKLLPVEHNHLFSKGSRILVTSKDRQVLKNIVGDGNLIYEVKGLSEEDSLQLFSLNAFKQNHPISHRLELSNKVLSYARGHPLALVVLGHALYDRSDELWHSALSVFGKEPFPDIDKVLRISYDALREEEKMIFLDIASFLVGKKLDFVVIYYKGKVNGIEFKISNLVDKCLVTISKTKTLEMHDLLKEMGRSIEKTLKKRRRILDLKDLTHVSKKKKGSSMIEAISVNLSEAEGISEFDCSVLSKMHNLKFLEIYRDFERIESEVRFRWERPTCISDELKYFRWDAYPHEALPSNFCAENLVELHMPYSQVTELWKGKQNIVNLKVINLRKALRLVEFPDVSKGRNVEEINLGGCESLVKVSPSVQHLLKLKYLTIQESSCPTRIVRSGPTTFDSEVLKTLSLEGGWDAFPQLASQNVITELKFVYTGMTELPSSIELLRGLEAICIKRCNKLSIISTSICKLKSLRKLILTDCTNLESFPDIMEPMESLEWLSLRGCLRLKSLPNSFHNLKSLTHLVLGGTAITELPSSIQHLVRLESLDLHDCRNIKSVPNLGSVQLLNFVVSGCSNLTSVPELPSSLKILNADGCVSLKTISSVRFTCENMRFSNCLNWDEEERRRVVDIAISNLNRGIWKHQDSEIVLPWSEIPQGFSGIQSVGSSVTLKIPPMDDGLRYRFAFCVVINPVVEEINRNSLRVSLNDVHGQTFPRLPSIRLVHMSKNIEHLLLWYGSYTDNEMMKYAGREVSLQFQDRKGKVEVTRCGVAIFQRKVKAFL